jgi:uncharacterized protein (DUF952 family)
MSELIFKVVTRQAWEQAVSAGRFVGAAIDLSDGYIHFSSADQLVETVRRHFVDQDGLVIVTVEASRLGDQLVWEPSRGGDLFPHLYGELPTALAMEVTELPMDEDGTHRFPPGPWKR